MDVMQAIKERRSIRKYRSDTVPEDALNTIFEAARWAPSWANSQCWRLIAVRDKETKSKLAEALKSRKPGTKNAASEAVSNAPIVLVACAERGRSGYGRDEEGQKVLATDKGEYWFMFDVGLAMQNVALAAHALGLGTVHIGLFDAVEVARILEIPENVAVVELMPLGWPEGEQAAPQRKDTGEFVFYEKYPAVETSTE